MALTSRDDAIIHQLMMPRSNYPEYDDEFDLAQKALDLNQAGIKARFSVDGSRQSPIGKVLDGGRLMYEDPRLPGKHIELTVVEDNIHYEVVDGSLAHREAYESHVIRTSHSEPYFDEQYSMGYSPKHDNPGSDAARYQLQLEKVQPLEEKYLNKIKDQLKLNNSYNRWIPRGV
jgi:hypothetical protein